MTHQQIGLLVALVLIVLALTGCAKKINADGSVSRTVDPQKIAALMHQAAPVVRSLAEAHIGRLREMDPEKAAVLAERLPRLLDELQKIKLKLDAWEGGALNATVANAAEFLRELITLADSMGWIDLGNKYRHILDGYVAPLLAGAELLGTPSAQPSNYARFDYDSWSLSL